MVGLGTWRFLVGPVPSYRGSVVYLSITALASVCITMAGFFGGEMLIGH
jgi:hypothetical protein